MKRFALADTSPNPHLTIDAAQSAVIVKTGQMASGRHMVEIWRDGTILCRVFAASVQIEPESGQHTETALRAVLESTV